MDNAMAVGAPALPKVVGGLALLAAFFLGGMGVRTAEAMDPAFGAEGAVQATLGAEEDVRPGGATWVESAAGLDLGMVQFGFRGERREWNLGIGRAVGFAPRSRWSFVGAGLTVARPVADDPLVPGDASPLEGVEVKPWVGGCVNCPLGEIIQLGLELKWAPGSAALLDDEDTGPEGSAGISLGVEW